MCATCEDCYSYSFAQSGVGAVGSGLGAVGGAVGGGLHVPSFGSTDASSLALKARETAVLKREEAAAVRFVCPQIACCGSFFNHVAGPCRCHQRSIACFGSGRMEPQQQQRVVFDFILRRIYAFGQLNISVVMG